MSRGLGRKLSELTEGSKKRIKLREKFIYKPTDKLGRRKKYIVKLKGTPDESK